MTMVASGTVRKVGQDDVLASSTGRAADIHGSNIRHRGRRA